MKVGRNTVISSKASIYGSDNIEIGDNVRIDDFCILSGGAGLKIGSHIHISAYGALYGGAGIELEDFSEFGPRLTILSQSDDFSGESLIGPCIPNKYKPRFKSAAVKICHHVVLGVCCTVLPGVTIGEGVAIGACSLIMKNLDSWFIYAGSPVKKIKERSRKMMELEQQFLKEYHG